ncbi:UMP kinase [Patescibacteria group bacterium]|nr:UMP kinase [Patescibacteria group bacterium]
MTKKTLIISLGGSLVFPGEDIDIQYLKKFRQFVISLIRKKYRLVIIVGGGRINNKYNQAAKKVAKVKPVDLDWLGIKVANTNSELVRVVLADYVYPEVIRDPFTKIKTTKPVIIGTAFKPGSSTDLRAVQFALNLKAKTVINLTDVDFVYDKDPGKYQNAKPITQIAWSRYKKMFGSKWTPRLSAPFDPIATKLAWQKGIEVVILNGKKLQNIERYLENKEYKGTIIKK